MTAKTMDVNYEALYQDIGYEFNNKDLLIDALVHPSVSNFRGRKRNSKIYQRLEFLGDRILGFVIGEAMFSQFPSDNEGILSKKYAALVSRETCKEIALNIKLNEYIIISHDEDLLSGRGNKSSLANSLESLIAAIFLDSGIEEAKNFILTHWEVYINENIEHIRLSDYKNELQEFSQGKYKELPIYELIAEEGMDHNKNFTISVKIQGISKVGHGTGFSKKEAEKNAAKNLLELLKIL